MPQTHDYTAATPVLLHFLQFAALEFACRCQSNVVPAIGVRKASHTQVHSSHTHFVTFHAVGSTGVCLQVPEHYKLQREPVQLHGDVTPGFGQVTMPCLRHVSTQQPHPFCCVLCSLQRWSVPAGARALQAAAGAGAAAWGCDIRLWAGEQTAGLPHCKSAPWAPRAAAGGPA